VRVGLNLEQLLQPVPGGTGRYAAAIARLLPVLFPGDVVAPFVARHPRPEVESAFRRFGIEAVAADAVVLPLPRPLLYDSWHLAGAPAPTRRAPSLAACDLVHAPSPAVPPRGGRPLVVSVHDAAFVLFPEAYPRRGLRFHRQGVAAAARRADLVLTGSSAAAEEIAAHTPIPAARIRVVPYGVDHVAATAADVAATLGRFGLSDLPYVLWVGTLEPRKNVGTLVRAFGSLARAVPHRLVLVGPEGWLRRGLVPGDDTARVGDRLRVLGHVPESDLRALYAGADLFCLPSLHEGFGLPVLEAMAQGTPVVCADVPALAEVSGGAARLVPPLAVDEWSAALAELLDDARLRSALAQRGRARAAELSWERCVTGTRAVYEELVGR
jgi:glycosyltransferase involved in cell wall biosynthesis